MKRRYLRLPLHALLALLVLWPLGQRAASAHEVQPPFYWKNEVLPVVSDPTSLNWYSFYAAIDFDQNTTLVMSYCGNGPCGNILFNEGYYEPRWIALAVPYSWYDGAWHECADWWSSNITGACDTAFRRAEFAYIYYNHDGYNVYDGKEHNRARHELNHVFGMAHNNDVSVMNIARNDAALTSHDQGDINVRYAQ